jgi:L-amino acid N-acyltransferase YncA
MAAGLVKLRSGGRILVRSAGSEPADSLNPAVVEAMAEVGVDISEEFPKPLTRDAVQAADVVITMGCGDACPVFPGKRYEDWRLDDPAGHEPDHWPAAERIYLDGIATGDATFETTAPSWEAWEGAHIHGLRVVALDRAAVVGWAALSAASDRCVYGGVAEESVYVAELARGQVVGRKLLEDLISRSEAAGVWTIQTGIFPENHASLRLHERVGFRLVGVRERIGKLNGVWRDVVFLERRSPVVR